MRCLSRCSTPGALQGQGRGARRGAALLETLVALVILAVGIMNAVMASMESSDLQRSTASYIQAHNTSRDILEQLQSGQLTLQYLAFAATPDFEVSGQQVSVTFPVDMLEELHGGAVPNTARYRDDDGDGEVEIDLLSNELAGLLPVRIVVTEGNLRFQLDSLISEF